APSMATRPPSCPLSSTAPPLEAAAAPKAMITVATTMATRATMLNSAQPITTRQRSRITWKPARAASLGEKAVIGPRPTRGYPIRSSLAAADSSAQRRVGRAAQRTLGRRVVQLTVDQGAGGGDHRVV